MFLSRCRTVGLVVSIGWTSQLQWVAGYRGAVLEIDKCRDQARDNKNLNHHREDGIRKEEAERGTVKALTGLGCCLPPGPDGWNYAFLW